MSTLRDEFRRFHLPFWILIGVMGIFIPGVNCLLSSYPVFPIWVPLGSAILFLLDCGYLLIRYCEQLKKDER